MRCSPTSRRAAPRMRCRCSPSRWSGSTASTTAAAISSSSHYRALGGVKGSIEAAVERAFKAADADPAIPKDRVARLALLRRGLIPWLAGIDPDTGAPRRRVARLVGNPRRGTAADPAPRRAAPARDRCGQGHRRAAPSSRRTRRCCGNGACWRAGSRKMPACSPCWKASSAQAAIGRRTTAMPRLAHARDRSAGRGRAAQRAARPRRQPGADGSRLPRRMPQGRGRRQDAASGACRPSSTCCWSASSSAWSAGSIRRTSRSNGAGLRPCGPFMRREIRPYVLTAAAEQALKPHDAFRECATEAQGLLPGDDRRPGGRHS